MSPRSTARTWLALRELPLLALVLALLVLGSPETAHAQAPPSAPEAQPAATQGPALRFGGGSESGRFTAIARKLASAVEGELPLQPIVTAGSCDNIRKLASGELDVALVKYDVAAEALAAATADPEAHGEHGESGWMCDLQPAELAGVELQLVAAVEESAAHLMLRRPVRLDELSELGQRPIFVGQHGSGSMETSKILLGAAGLTLDDVNSLDVGNKAAIAAMTRGELLMLLRTTKVGTTSVSRLLATGVASLNPLPESVVSRLIDGFPYYRPCSIPAHSYPGQGVDVPTVCVSTVVLTAHREGEPQLSKAEVLQLIEGLAALEEADELGPLRWQGFAARTPVPLHAGAKQRDIDARTHLPGELRFGGGGRNGSFTATATALAEAVEAVEAPFELDVRVTGGSCDNVRKLARGELDAALVHYSVAAEAHTAAAAAAHLSEDEARDIDESGDGSGWMCGLHPAELTGVELQLIAAVDDAAAHLIVRRPVRLDHFEDLGEQPIFVGQRGSGSLETSKVILGAAGLTLDDVNALDISNKSSLELMRRGDLLMMLRTTRVGGGKITNLLATGTAGLNALPDEITEQLLDGTPYYRVCQIDADTYPGLNFGLPTVCVSTVVLTARHDGADALTQDEVLGLIDGMRWLERHPEPRASIHLRWRGFAEREPIPLHDGAVWAERRDLALYWAEILVLLGLGLGVLLLARRYLQRRGILGNPLSGSNLEGQLSNPLVPFVGFLFIVGLATLSVWSLEHDSNARVRTLNDSFWEMNMFATGNFDSESLKTAQARVIGVGATIAGLGLLAWFTAALTSILSRDQMRLFRRRRNHIVILNFREEMLQLIRVLRSPGPQRQRPIHVVVTDELPARVRAQLARVRGLTIYDQNPEVPEELIELRLPRAARVLVLQGGYHPLRIARAVHHACVRLDPRARAESMKRAQLGLSPSVQSPSVAGDNARGRSQVPVTLVEAGEDDADGLYDPFSRWLMPVPARDLADAWLANACLDPRFGDFFNSIVTFRNDNSELYTVAIPAGLRGKTWRELRRALYRAKSRAGIVPIGLYRGHLGALAYAEDDIADSSPAAELARRLQINPPLDRVLGEDDRLMAFAEDEADLRKVLKGLF